MLNLLTIVGFPLITLVFFYLLLKEFHKAINLTAWSAPVKSKSFKSIVIALILWLIVVSIASLSGFASQFNLFPLNVAPVVFVPLITILVLIFRRKSDPFIEKLNLKVITYLQVFRVFVEIVLWLLFIENLLPVQMTFEGRNFDILAGITSIFASLFLIKSKHWMIVWNIIGLILLINIVSIAVLSMPTFLQVFHNEPSNTIVTKFPYILLPTFLVPLAYTLHFLSLKKLFMKSN